MIEFLIYSDVKAGIYGTAAIKNTSSIVGGPILRCEGLGREKYINLRESGQESFLGHTIGAKYSIYKINWKYDFLHAEAE